MKPLFLFNTIWLSLAFPSFQSLTAAIPYVDLETNAEGYLDLRELDPVSAFTYLAYAMSVSYPLSEWKAVDWDTRYDTLLPEVRRNVLTGNEKGLFRTIREFALSAPDGHIAVGSWNFNAFPMMPSPEVDPVAVDYGFIAVPLDSGQWMLLVRPEGSAMDAGLQSGDLLHSIQGTSPETASLAKGVDWLNMGTPTSEADLLFRGMALGYSAGSDAIELISSKPGSETRRTHYLGGRPTQSIPFHRYQLEVPDEDWLSSTMVSEHTGYLRIGKLISNQLMDNLTPARYRAFIENADKAVGNALNTLQSSGAEALILDLRGNLGGIDALGARIAGYFSGSTDTYSVLLPFIDEETGWNPDIKEIEFTNPKNNGFPGRVVVLANHYTISAGERLAEYVGSLPHGRQVGLWSTNGSYAESGGAALLPEDMFVTWPIAPHVDEDGNISIDAGFDREARVCPDIRLSHSAANLLAWWEPSADPELDAAVEIIKDPLFGYFPGSREAGNGWIRHEHLGWLWAEGLPWAWHPQMGWLYLNGRGGNTLLVHSQEHGWLWSEHHLLPWFYGASCGWIRL